MNIIDPSIGVIPTKKAPGRGEMIRLTIKGLPPAKNLSMSIRNTKSKDYGAFKKLRLAGLKTMNGRRWYDGPIKVSITFFSTDKNLAVFKHSHIGGIMDTLGGSHGFTFTYLPIVYQDDCQPTEIVRSIKQAKDTYYVIEIEFL